MSKETETVEKAKQPTGRNWNASLQPAWSAEKMHEFATQMLGVAVVWMITHDKDVNNETGEMIEPHTHVVLEYETPRKLSSIANLLDVAPNFVEISRNQGNIRRYLCHLNDPDKFQYDPGLVITNSPVTYTDAISGKLLSNKDIAEYIKAGRGQELLDVVAPGKLRQIQSFINFDHQNETRALLGHIHEELVDINQALQEVRALSLEFKEGINRTKDEMLTGFGLIATSIEKVAEKATFAKMAMVKRRR